MRKIRSLLLIFIFLPLPGFSQNDHPGVVAAMSSIRQIMEGKETEAYESASESFRKVNTREQFRNFVSRMNADELVSVEIDRATGANDGSNVTVYAKGKNRDGESRQVEIFTIKEGNAFRMRHFRVRSQGTAGPPPTSDPKAATELARASLQRLADAIESGDFKPYLNGISMIHRQTFGDETLIRLAKQLDATRYGPVSSFIDRLQPGKPATMNGGVARYHFVVDYPDLKRRLLLHFVSLWSEPNPAPWPNRWQLQFFDPDGSQEKPTQDEVTQLSRKALSGLLSGFAQKDLAPFYSKGAPFFREVVPFQNFQASFPAFMEDKVDFSGWKGNEVKVLDFDLTGSLSKALRVEVQIPTPNAPAYGTLTFLKEKDTWEFSGIVFHSKPPGDRNTGAPR